jgi:hypothetical protein
MVEERCSKQKLSQPKHLSVLCALQVVIARQTACLLPRRAVVWSLMTAPLLQTA